MNALVQEIRNVIVGAGLTPSKSNNAQLLAALGSLYGHGRLLNIQYKTSTGTYTPTNVTNAVHFRMGLGGGGAEEAAASQSARPVFRLAGGGAGGRLF